MPSNHIEISGTGSRAAAQLRALIDQTRQTSNTALQVLAVCTTYLGDAPDLTNNATFADLAVALGFSGVNANSDAKKVYNLLVAAQGNLSGNKISNFVDQLG